MEPPNSYVLSGLPTEPSVSNSQTTSSTLNTLLTYTAINISWEVDKGVSV